MSERMLLTLNMLAPNCGTLLGITVLEFNRRWYDALAKPYRLTDTGPLMLLVLSALVNCLVGVAALQVINYAATKFRTRTAIENTEFRSRMKVSLFWLCLVYLIQVVTYGAWWLSLFGMQSFRFSLMMLHIHAFFVLLVGYQFHYNVKTAGYLYVPYVFAFLPYLFYQTIFMWNINSPVSYI